MEEKGELITGKEAIQIFIDAGLSVQTFRRRVALGEIDSVLPEGRKRGALFPKDQVLASVAMKAKDKPKKHIERETTVFSQATPSDMPEMAALLETFYKAKISVEKRSAWMVRNPQVAFLLRTGHEGKVVGCAFLMPLSEAKILQILEHQVKPPTLPGEISLYEPGQTHRYTLYVRAVGVLQSVSKVQRRHWAARLIAGLVRSVVELGENGIYIEKIYAQGDTKAGEKALKQLGFMQINLRAPTTRKNFVLDINVSGSPFVAKYREALTQWRSQNEEE